MTGMKIKKYAVPVAAASFLYLSPVAIEAAEEEADEQAEQVKENEIDGVVDTGTEVETEIDESVNTEATDEDHVEDTDNQTDIEENGTVEEDPSSENDMDETIDQDTEKSDDHTEQPNQNEADDGDTDSIETEETDETDPVQTDDTDELADTEEPEEEETPKETITETPIKKESTVTPKKSTLMKTTSQTEYKVGDRDPSVTEMKKKLNKIGFGGIKVTDVYGDFTAKRIKQFQAEYGLKVTGVADQATLAKIDEIYYSPIQLGKRHEYLIPLKHKLNFLGFGNIKATNYFGTFTEKKVKDFQSTYKLPISGIIDTKTGQYIERIFSEVYQLNGKHEKIKEMKRHLNHIGFGGIKVTDFYGTHTATRVKQFQSYYGLNATGKADIDTLLKLKEVANSPYQSGKSHTNTVTLKQNLNKLGFGNIKVTTYYGDFTAKKVKDFQSYYGLKANGIADEKTFAKIKEILNSPLQLGKKSKEIEQLKNDLNALGYSGIKVTTFFGDFTEKRLKQFQKDHLLPVSGIAEENTLAKIAAQIAKIAPKIKTTYTDYKMTLKDAVTLQSKQLTITDKYRNDPAFVSAKYLKITGASKITGSTVNVRTSPSTDSSIAYTFVQGTPIHISGTKTGTMISGSTLWYEIAYLGGTYFVHSSLASALEAEVTDTVNVRAGAGTSYHIFGQLKKGDKVALINPGSDWMEIKYNVWRTPTTADIQAYMTPANNDSLQHLRLDSSVNVTATELNKVLTGKGILDGKGQAFINGATKHGINEAYLISHAFLESGNGTSKLAQGVEVGKTKDGKLVLVTSSNRSSLTDIKKTYNMFGIGAIDSDPLAQGAITAYKNGWFTPEAAIEGGAAWIGKDYIYNQHSQNTLYKMKWNPRMSEGYVWKQYATDIAWAVKQTQQIKSIYAQLDNPSYYYDLPTYY